MAVVPPALPGPVPLPADRSISGALPDSLRHAPLVPAALALTTGILIDRSVGIPFGASLIVVAASLAAWAACRVGRQTGLAQVYLALAIAAFGASYHHIRREVYRSDDISHYASENEQVVRLRGLLAAEPIINRQPPNDPLRTMPARDTTRTVLRVTHLKMVDEWVGVSGRVRLAVEGHLRDLHVGDEVSVVGRLSLAQPPSNPGEFDSISALRDQNIRAIVSVEEAAQAVSREGMGWRTSLLGWLAVVRGWGQRVLQEELPAPESGVAMALLLGEGSTMTTAQQEKYLRTGVIHVLAISGQHLVVLAWFLWWTLRLLGVRRRWGAVVVALFLLNYALLTGGRPPVMRAAATVCVVCGGIVLRRPSNPANTFALAWIVVALLTPGDLFTTGCQLSFLAVAVLGWGASRWSRTEADPLERLVDESRSTWERAIRAAARWVLVTYAASALIWVTAAPLVAARYHLVSPAGLVLTPPMLLLTSVALIAGFLLLLAAAVCWPLVPVLAALTRWSLAGCDGLVNAADGLPGAYWYVSDLPEWWLWVFYFTLFAVLLIEPLRPAWRWLGLAWLAWLAVGLLGGLVRPTGQELRCTFLAVGHGGCTVLETPDGRTILYDAGAMAGPDVARRQIAPFLWHRGVRRIDEIMLSHADLDHFNGLAALLDRFTIAQVTCTPTFAERASPGVRVTLEALKRRGVPVRIVKAGDCLMAGDVAMDVLHPPASGPEGNENARSLVLRVRHGSHSILLTGDLEGPGMARLLAMPPDDVDVLMAPHHGSRSASPAKLAEWARPEVVISCQGRPRWPSDTPSFYEARGARFLGTWPHGAITVRSRPDELIVETYRTGERLVVR